MQDHLPVGLPLSSHHVAIHALDHQPVSYHRGCEGALDTPGLSQDNGIAMHNIADFGDMEHW